MPKPKPKLKTAPWKPSWWPDWKNEPLTFPINPDDALRRCAYNRLPTSRKKSVKNRLKSR
jgi:hypothetical protein